MTVNASTEPAASALTFCREYVELAGDLAGIAKVFLIAALVLGIAYAIVETIKKFREGPALTPRAAPGTSTIKELIEALKGFIEALAKAPAWLGLFGVGLLLFWVAGASLPDSCKAALNEPYGTTSPPATPGAGDNTQNAAGNASGAAGNVSGGTGKVSGGTGNVATTTNTSR